MWVPTILTDDYSLVSGVTSHISWDYKLVSFTVGWLVQPLVLFLPVSKKLLTVIFGEKPLTKIQPKDIVVHTALPWLVAFGTFWMALFIPKKL